MLTQLSATNFKSWPTLGPMRLAPITGLFGTNSSGKSSVLQLLLMLKQTVESSDRAAVLEFGDEASPTNLGSFRDVVFEHRKTASLDFDVRWKRDEPLSIADPNRRGNKLLSGNSMGFRARVSDKKSEKPVEKLAVDEFAYSVEDSVFTMRLKNGTASKYDLLSSTDGLRPSRSVGRPWDLPAPVKFYGFPDQTYAYFTNVGFLADLQLGFERQLRNVYYLGPLRNFPKRHYALRGSEPTDLGYRGEHVVDAILASRERPPMSLGKGRKRQSLEERVAHWLKELGLIHAFTVEAIAEGSKLYHVQVQKSPGGPKVLVPDVGFGVSQVLPVLVLCYYVPEGSTILLEQPEIHLHPPVQSALADVFIDVAKNRKVQIILESHSEHLLRRFQARIAVQVLGPEDTAFYFCEASKDGSTATELGTNLVGEIRNWPTDFFGNEWNDIAAMHEAKMNRLSRSGK